MVLTSESSQEQKFGCRELSKTTSSCRDLAVETNASASPVLDLIADQVNG
jgi:hypothetical protein